MSWKTSRKFQGIMFQQLNLAQRKSKVRAKKRPLIVNMEAIGNLDKQFM